eukprot:3475100-Rhodomonas_salina.1
MSAVQTAVQTAVLTQRMVLPVTITDIASVYGATRRYRSRASATNRLLLLAASQVLPAAVYGGDYAVYGGNAAVYCGSAAVYGGCVAVYGGSAVGSDADT